MAMFRIIINNNINEDLLKEINCKLDKLLAGNGNDAVIKKAATDLDTSTKKLDEAVKKNTPKS